MTETAFLRLVKEMRDAQINYFRTRSYDALQECKRLEKAVDNAIDQADEGPELFDKKGA